MTFLRMMQVTIASVVLCAFGTANAISITMVPGSQLAAPSTQVTIEIFGDFSDDPTLGGGFDILFNPAQVQVLDVVQAAVGDPDFTSLGGIDNASGIVSSVAFGDFGGIAGAGFLIATITVEYLGGGPAVLAMQDNADAAGPFFSAATFQQQTVQYNGAEIQPIPVPAAAWLMLGGLGALFGFGRKRN